jgi:hypothetical protein
VADVKLLQVDQCLQATDLSNAIALSGKQPPHYERAVSPETTFITRKHAYLEAEHCQSGQVADVLKVP